MLQATAIGHIGGDAEVKSTNGKEFTTFRIAHTDKWTDESGQEHTNTQWIDCTMNGKPAVLEWLKKGQMVCVMGNLSTRIYSSAKDRCMKAG
ncbi:MAG: single-stranded DNA-binding protein, partial [Fibrobacteraceae bacterium]|nr:single-stranded DNA-binding protein [Fibrobacteraceae bacterium]